jgi:hypothetical protein
MAVALVYAGFLLGVLALVSFAKPLKSLGVRTGAPPPVSWSSPSASS